MYQHVTLRSPGQAQWGGRTVAIVGGGTSLSGFDFNRLRDRFTVLAVNASMFDIPFADAGFSIDSRALYEWWPRLIELPYQQFYAVPDNRIRIPSRPGPRMTFIRRYQGTELTTTSGRITAGGTSGFGALHLAFLRGAKKIVLFGYDYSQGPAAWHHNEQHYTFRHDQNAKLWAQWAKNFDHAAAVLKKHRVEVINASPDSAITAFPKCSVEEAISL